MIQRILKDATSYGLLNVISQFIGVLLIPLYTFFLPPDQFGVLDILVTTTAIIIIISGLQIESGVARSYYEAKKINNDRLLTGTAIWLFIIGSIIGTILICLFFQLWLRNYLNLGWEFILPIVLIIFPSQIFGFATIIFRLDQNIRHFSIINLGNIITSAFFCMILLIFANGGVLGILWGLLISKVIWSIFAVYFLSNSINFSFNIKCAKEILLYSIPTVPSTLMGWAQNFANRFILVAYLSLTAVGIFSLAVRIASGAMVFIGAFRMAWYPYALEIMGKPKFGEQYAKMLDYYFFGAFCVCSLISVFGIVIIGILSPKSYFFAGSLIGFISFGLFWTGSLEILVLGIDFVRKTYLGFIAITVGVIINLLILFVTISSWNLFAAGVAYLAGTIVTAIITLFLSQSQFYVPYRASTFIGMIFLSIFFSLFIYISYTDLFFLNSVIINLGIKLFVTGVIWIILFSALLSQEDRDQIYTRIKSLLPFNR